MKILLIPREGVDLYHTLVSSETSRLTLRFYKPERVSCGVLLRVSSLGSAVSIIAELKWYVTRYMQDVLFEVSGDIYCTQALAEMVYERDVRLEAPWEIRFLYAFKGGQIQNVLQMEPGTPKEKYIGDLTDSEKILEVWAAASDVN